MACPMANLVEELTPETVVAPEISYGAGGLVLDYLNQSDEWVRTAFDPLSVTLM